MTIQAVTVDLLANDGTTVQSGLRVDGRSTSFDDELNDTGSAQVTLPASVAGASAIDAGSLLRFRVDGTTDFTARVVPPIDRTVAAKDLADVQFTVHAKGWLDEWSDHLVQPPMGRATLPVWDEVTYDWRHPIVPLTGSVVPTYLGSLFGGDLDPFGGAATPQPTAKGGWPPRNWADTFTGWISGAAVDGNGSHPVDAVCYGTVDLPVSAGKINGQFTADDSGELAVGGVVVSSCSNWTQAQDWGLDDVTSGTVTLRVKVENAVNAGNPGNLLNPLAWAVTVWQAGSSTFKTFPNVVLRTGLNVGPGFPLPLGGKWSVLWSPGSPPGITVARAVRHQFELAQASGGPLTSWTLDFTDTLDSNGSPWPVRDDITARTSDTLLVWLRSLCTRGMCDMQADPAARKLRLFLPGHCGNFWTAPGSPPSWTGAHLSQVDVARRW